MATLPESQHTTHAAIVKWYESKPQQHRPHMGASLIGHECDRHIWLTWRWALTPSFPGRILRLFSTGQREEPRLVEELKGIGATVWETDPNTGDQWRVSACNGHFGGSLDGVAKGLPEAPKTPAVLEFKTHSNKSFTDLVKNKVQLSKPQHYIQMQIYMGLMDLTRALYMAVNKDTDDLYTEWVQFDRERFEFMLSRAQRLIEMTEPPAGISTDPANWQCKMCSHWRYCHGGVAAEANCRTCVHATPVENAQWRCEYHGNAVLSDQAQRDGCEVHLLIPALIPYAEPIDGADGWMAYRHKETGAQFVNAAEGVNDYGPVFSSKELHNCPAACLEGIAEIKNEFGGKVVSGDINNDEFRTWLNEVATDPADLKATPPTQEQRQTRKKNQAFMDALSKIGGE
jgi:hypothetical protein